MMDRNEAIVALGDTSQEVRLQGARFFSGHANADDEELLNRFLLKESVPWIKRAIETALRRIEHTVEQKRKQKSLLMKQFLNRLSGASAQTLLMK